MCSVVFCGIILTDMRVRRKHYRRQSPFHFKLKKQAYRTVASLGLIGLSALILLAFFGNGGMAEEVKGVLVTYFGWSAVVLPVLTIMAGLLFTKIRLPGISFNTFFGATLLLFSLLGFTTLLGSQSSGLAGTYLARTASVIFSNIGAYILFFFASVFSLIIFFNTSLDETVKIVGAIFSAVARALGALKGIRLPSLSKPADTSDKLPFITKGLRPNLGPERRLIKEPKEETPLALAAQSVTNLPMENKVWEYPPLELLSEQLGSKANRGDIKQNAAVIEKTLESSGSEFWAGCDPICFGNCPRH